MLPPLLLRPFDTAYRINPLAERAVDRLNRAAPDIGMARRDAGVQRLPSPGFVRLVVALRDERRRCRQGLGNLVRGGPRALGKAEGECSADFLVPPIDKGAPQPLPVLLAEPSDLFQHS